MAIRLIVDGSVYEGWISAEIDRSLGDFASRFSLGMLDRWTPETKPWPIRTGAKCTVNWDSEVLITGYVNRVNMVATADGWQLSAEGRSLAGDLVDASAVHKTGHWKAKTASAIAKDLLAPYGLSLSVDGLDLDTYPRFALQEGESVHAALDRLCKVRALLPISKPDGGVRLFSADFPSGAVLPLAVDEAQSRGFSENDSDRFSEYLLRSTGVGTPEEAFAKAEISDPGVARFRPLVVVGDAPSQTAQAKVRAQWECNVRAGRAESLDYTFYGAVNSFGKTYAPGQKYVIRDDLFGVDGIFLLDRAILSAGEESLRSVLSFVRPEAYSQLPYPKKKLAGKTKLGKQIFKKTQRGGL